MKLTQDQIINYLCNSEAVMAFYNSALKIGFRSDFPHHKIENINWYLEVAEINDIFEIDNLLNNNKDVLNRYIAKIYANSKNPWRINHAFMCGLALIAKFPDLFSVEKLIENGWSEDAASTVIAAANLYRPYFA